MTTFTPAQCASQEASMTNLKEAMRSHRANTPQQKRPVHPGVTQREAGFTPAERRRLLDGVCEGLADQTLRGERWANRALVVLTVLLLLAIGVGMLQDRWAEKKQVQTVEAR